MDLIKEFKKRKKEREELFPGGSERIWNMVPGDFYYVNDSSGPIRNVTYEAGESYITTTGDATSFLGMLGPDYEGHIIQDRVRAWRND